ncbi:MAG: hypothetical protein ACERKZ_09570 [Lachnotalea sp.]
MKKIVAIVLAVGMMFSLTACKDSNSDTQATTESNTFTVGFPPFSHSLEIKYLHTD